MNENRKPKMDQLRTRSGMVKINSRLVSFLYDLMRDHFPVGEVEKLVQDAEDEPEVLYTNGWLATYAEDLAKRLGDVKDCNNEKEQTL